MKLRPPLLADVDPQAVPLPSGTEVTTRVDRVVGDCTVAAGALGRVTRTENDRVRVALIGVGPATYLRSELAPRNAGQLRFAVRRHTAWCALRPCVVLDAVVGSRAWGLATPESDTDRRGVFALPFSWTGGLTSPPTELVSIDGSEVYWEFGKAVRQALRADPNTLEMLYVDELSADDELGQWLVEARDAFASQEIYRSFGRYALSQLKKLESSYRLVEHRGQVLQWLRADATMSLEQLAARLAASTEPEATQHSAAIERARDYLKQLYSSLYDRGIIERRELSALADYAKSARADFALPRQLRPKNAYNLLRLIDAAIVWLREGAPHLRVRAPLRSTLVQIKQGQLPLPEVLRLARDMTAELEAARHASPLPARADVKRADRLLRRVHEQLARRWIENHPGPFGADAPELQDARWND